MHPGKVHAILLGLVFEKIVENQLFFYKEALWRFIKEFWKSG